MVKSQTPLVRRHVSELPDSANANQRRRKVTRHTTYAAFESRGDRVNGETLFVPAPVRKVLPPETGFHTAGKEISETIRLPKSSRPLPDHITIKFFASESMPLDKKMDHFS